MESPTTATVCPWGLPPLTESVQWGVVVGQETGCAEAGTTLKPRGNPHARPSATRDFFMVFRGYASGPNTASSIVVRTPGDWPEGRQGHPPLSLGVRWDVKPRYRGQLTRLPPRQEPCDTDEPALGCHPSSGEPIPLRKGCLNRCCSPSSEIEVSSLPATGTRA